MEVMVTLPTATPRGANSASSATTLEAAEGPTCVMACTVMAVTATPAPGPARAYDDVFSPVSTVFCSPLTL